MTAKKGRPGGRISEAQHIMVRTNVRVMMEALDLSRYSLPSASNGDMSKSTVDRIFQENQLPPTRRLVSLLVKFWNRHLLPAVTVDQFLNEALDPKKVSPLDGPDLRFANRYMAFYRTQYDEMACASLDVFPSENRLMASLITGFRHEEDMQCFSVQRGPIARELLDQHGLQQYLGELTLDDMVLSGVFRNIHKNCSIHAQLLAAPFLSENLDRSFLGGMANYLFQGTMSQACLVLAERPACLKSAAAMILEERIQISPYKEHQWYSIIKRPKR